MLLTLASHNDDIRRLLERGYALGVDSNYLIVRDVPYLDGTGSVQTGAIVTKFVDTDGAHVVQEDHQVFFAGSHPHGLDGRPIANLGGGATTLALSEACKDVVVQRSFSNKPKATGKFVDFFDKIESYVGIISGPAQAKHDVSPLTFRMVASAGVSSVFKFRDTLTSRAEITDLSAKFSDEVVAIIGLGGTGAYVLDFLARTRVKEIRGFDNDQYFVHNAYRSPGRVEQDEFNQAKADVYQARYSSFRRGLTLNVKFIDASCAEEMEGVTFAFVCVDKGSSRKAIFDLLISLDIPFIDVGMGLNRKHGPIDGMMRTTLFAAGEGKAMMERLLAPLADSPDNIYKTNIQIAELNALNASIAVIRYKQLRGFYAEEIPYRHLAFGVGDMSSTGVIESSAN